MIEAFPYQIVGAEWLATKTQALLADEMGLGKSAQAIIAADAVGAQSILVVCPAAVRINWSREFGRFSARSLPINVIMTGKDPINDHGVNIVSYDLLVSAKRIFTELYARDWDVLILDECHYLKDRAAKRTRAIYGKRGAQGLSSKTNRVWRLSGTPVPNNASELWTHLYSAGVTKQNYWDFTFQYCTGFDSGYGFKISGHQNTSHLKQVLEPFMLRRKKMDVITDLPPITFAEVTVARNKVELDPWFYENYRVVGKEPFMAELNHLEDTLKQSLTTIKHASCGRNPDALDMIKAFAQSTPTLRRYIGLAKLDACLDIIADELETKAIDKIVLFAIHKDVVDSTRIALKRFKPVTLYGNTPHVKRQNNIDKFQNSPECRVFIGNIQAAGTGITLTSACEVAFLESSWVPADNAQAAMRCHRVGQTRPVRVRMFTCSDSVDEEVMRVVTHKTRQITKILD